MTFATHALRLALSLPAVALLVSCGGGGGDAGPSGPTVTSASIGALKYGQPTLVTINGTSLESDLSVSSAGCTGMTRSTAAPNISTATTAYYTCTVRAINAQTVAVTRTSTGAPLNTLSYTVPAPQVSMTVSNGAAVNGTMVITLAPDKTPGTVDNFLTYVNSGYYNGTKFHRIVKNFVIQGGGFLSDGTPQTGLRAAIPLEVGKGLSNVQWSIAMARVGGDANSATSQFFVNTVDNSDGLDPHSTPLFAGDDMFGYAVFGTVTTNIALVTAIENTTCTVSATGCVVIGSATQTR